MLDIDSVGCFDIAGQMDTAIDNEMIYLKIVDGEIEAYGDLQSIDADEGKSKKNSYDKAVTVKQWNEAGCVARIVDGEIVLGLSSEDQQKQNEERIRAERDYLLQLTCDTMSPMRWNALTEEEQNEWMEYRQALLDITNQKGFPWDGDLDKVPWPKMPK